MDGVAHGRARQCREAAAGPGDARQDGAYRLDIDGLRAVAVLAVVLFHAAPGLLPGGFAGVDVFFVISGFLISGHIGAALARGRFSLAGFYARRIRRIFPALAVVLAATLGFGTLVLLPQEFARLGRDAAGGAGFVSNLLLWNEAGYFDRAATAKPLLHLWSLGVEEQFYIAWPLLLGLAWRLRWRPAVVVGACVAASFVLNIAIAHGHPSADFYLPFTRVWELGAGALLAVPGGTPPLGRRARDGLSLAGGACLLAAVALLHADMAYPGWGALLPVLGAAAVIAAGPGALLNRAVLARRPAVWLGLVSYPLYLWHWPLISYALILSAGQPLRGGMVAGVLAASLVLAWATWRWVERPVRQGRPGERLARARTAAPALAVGVAGLAGLAVAAAAGFPGRYPALPRVEVAAINAAIRDGIFQPTPSMRSEKIDGITISRLGSGAPATVLVGDSLLYQYGPRAQALLDDGRLRGTVIFVAGPSCAPIPGMRKPGNFAYCAALPEVARQVIAGEGRASIVLGGFWAGYLLPDATVTRGGATWPLSAPAAEDALFANLRDEVAMWTERRMPVYLLLESPDDRRFDPQGMIARSLAGVRVAAGVRQGVPVAELAAQHADIARRLRAVAADTGALVLDPLPDICGTQPTCSPFFDGGQPKFADGMHMRPDFVRTRIHFLDPLLAVP